MLDASQVSPGATCASGELAVFATEIEKNGTARDKVDPAAIETEAIIDIAQFARSSTVVTLKLQGLK